MAPLVGWRRSVATTIAALVIALGLAACAALPEQIDKRPSVALANPGHTVMGRIAAKAVTRPQLSGIHLLSSGEEALASLIALAENARHTIDIQQYIIKPDASARAVMLRVHAAAERGVRVRLLLDDFNTAGHDESFLRLASHRNIEVRLFNPFPAGRNSLLTRLLASAGDARRIHRRMHNKQFIADNALAITGGRNIGDEYFVRNAVSNFVDLDVLVAGRVVPQMSVLFDRYWNSEHAYGIEALSTPTAVAKAAAVTPQTPILTAPVTVKTPEPDVAGAESTTVPTASEAPEPTAESAPVERSADFLMRDLARGALTLRSVPATLLADQPSKISHEDNPDEEDTVADDLSALMLSARSELLIISPYFVPGVEGVALFRTLRARDVRVRVLTNSLATTDAPAVHLGYERYRAELLGLGVDLHEMKPGLVQDRVKFTALGSGQSSLHAKALMIDGRTVFIGSLNMDPRSANINTEMGLLIRSAAIATQVRSLFAHAVEHNSYRLEITGPDQRLRWVSGQGSDAKIWHSEPETTFLQRLALRLLAPFAPEELL